MKNKLILPTLLILTIFLSSCYNKHTIVFDIDTNKQTCTVCSYVTYFVPFKYNNFDIYSNYICQVPFSKVKNLKNYENSKMDSVINFCKNNDVILK
jgi:hypothetical protein